MLDTRLTMELRKAAEDPNDLALSGSASGQEAGSSDDTITFYADGTADAQEIRLRDREGFQLALRINPITARVRITELERE